MWPGTMQDVNVAVQRLRDQISENEDVLNGLKADLRVAEQDNPQFSLSEHNIAKYETGLKCHGMVQFAQKPFLSEEEYRRYGRQMILPEVGIAGQLRLKNCAVLIVGVGGLGCPAATYLAGAGVGKVGLVDGDVVEMSNLHRQILHSTEKIGCLKVESAQDRLRHINSQVQYVVYNHHLASDHAVDLFKQYDVILDCTDHPASRYLVSDAAVLASRPLVFASALKTEGQLMVLNNPSSSPDDPSGTGLCYRCVFPKPPPPESATTCGEGGILGPVVGVMGVLMATEAIKLLLQSREHQNIMPQKLPPRPTMLLYSAFSDQPFRTIRLRGRRKDCPSCSGNPTITTSSLESGSLDYIAFCGGPTSQNNIADHDRISAQEYNQLRSHHSNPHILIDVREKPHFDLAHLQGSINMPFSEIQQDPSKCLEDITKAIDENPEIEMDVPMYLICRLGNDSQIALRSFREAAAKSLAWSTGRLRIIADLQGGLQAWRRDVDGGFPDY